MTTLSKSVYDYFSSNIIIAQSNIVNVDDIRLNAEYYEEGKSIIIKQDIVFFPLTEIATVVFPGIFKRYLVEDDKYGIKFLTTSDMMMLEPDSEKYLFFTTTLISMNIIMATFKSIQ